MKKKFFIAAIVARCGGNFPSEVCCTLFEKQSSNEFEQVGIDTRRCAACMRLCRCWVGLPAYSSLVLDVDLSEFGTERKLLKETIELRVEKVGVSNDELIVDDDIYIRVSVRWVSPTPQGRQESCGMELEEDDDESSDDEMSRGDEQMTEASCSPVASSSNPASHWALHAHQIRPFSTPSLEIFSVFIGREKFNKPLRVYGSIVVSSYACTFDVFKREAKEDAFGLSKHCKSIPVLDSSRAYEDCYSLDMKFDLKDAESRLHIRGYVDWDQRYLEEGSSWLDKQLCSVCSVVQGQNVGFGFAAIHYTIFSEEAVQANVELRTILKKNRGHDDLVYPKVHGTLVAQYNNYDYTSRYNKDYYRIVLFKRNRDDPAQPGTDGFTALSRSMVIVPLNSSLIIEANLVNGLVDQVLSYYL